VLAHGERTYVYIRKSIAKEEKKRAQLMQAKDNTETEGGKGEKKKGAS